MTLRTTPHPHPSAAPTTPAGSGTGTAANAAHITTTPDTGAPVTLLILGAGWTYQFLQPLLASERITHAATTTTGRDGTIPFKFDGESDDLGPFKNLPDAEYVLVTFPLKGRGPSAKLVRMYHETRGAALAAGGGHDHSSHKEALSTKWIQLGSTGLWTAADWNDSSAPIDETNARGVAEEELISLGGCVLNLAGLYGGERNPRNWVSRVAKSKEQLGEKGAVHLIHGWDVARAVVGVIRKGQGKGKARKGATDDPKFSSNNYDSDIKFASGLDGGGDAESEQNDGTGKVVATTTGTEDLFGRRWIVADCVSYDWWSLVWDWMGNSARRIESIQASTTPQDQETKLQYKRWVAELMDEKNVRGLPRSPDLLGRKLDARQFWRAVGILPERSLAR